MSGTSDREGGFSRRALLAATGSALIARRLAATAGAATAAGHRFRPGVDRQGWGDGWFGPHHTLAPDVRGGVARLALPAGLASTASDQPVPMFLLDHECRDGTQQLLFAVTSVELRPGLLLRRRDAGRFLGVTVERDRIVLAAYGRNRRRVIAHAPVPPLGPGDQVLRVAVAGRDLEAGVWSSGQPRRLQLRAQLSSVVSGTPGVLLVAPGDREPGTLLVRGYRLWSPDGFASTAPQAALLLTGTPRTGGGRIAVGLRAASDIPARIRFEWSHDCRFATGVASSPDYRPLPPYSARHDLSLHRSQPLFWRARLTSASSGAEQITPAQRYAPHLGGDRLVMAATSCAQLWGEVPYDGLRRLLEEGPAAPALLVYQGDLGYAGNRRDSCYLESPDFYAERFLRTLGDPHFTALRRQLPVGFTVDDHDYGQHNNGDSAQIPAWAVPLWNRLQADPSDLGCFDTRFGDVHCLTLDGRRYAQPATAPNGPGKTKLGVVQCDWLERILRTTTASLVVVFSADAFATRTNDDCFVFGWPDEYARLMTAFMDAQLRGRRVVILSGDAHGLRIYHHPDPAGRAAASGMSVVEFICSGLAPRSWSQPVDGDPTLDSTRFVLGHRGLGLIDIDPQTRPQRTVTLRAVNGERDGSFDLFPPLVLSFAPSRDPLLGVLPPPAPPYDLEADVAE